MTESNASPKTPLDKTYTELWYIIVSYGDGDHGAHFFSSEEKAQESFDYRYNNDPESLACDSVSILDPNHVDGYTLDKL